jgi:hypothetical protein
MNNKAINKAKAEAGRFTYSLLRMDTGESYSFKTNANDAIGTAKEYAEFFQGTFIVQEKDSWENKIRREFIFSFENLRGEIVNF